LGDVGLYAYPVFCDFDSDGDNDILVGRDSHGFIYFQNIGSASIANWQTETSSFAGLGQADYWNSADLVDLNNDGLYDLVHGTASGPLQYYINAGTATSPVWQQNTALFGGVLDVGGASSPVFYDFDNDGDLDLISGSQMGNIKYFENTGTIYSPAWVENSAYFSSIDHSIYAAVAIGDINGDNLPDAIIGDLSGNLYFHRNTGLGFAEEAGVLPVISLGGWSVPRLFDADADGDLDLATGCEAGTLRFYRNQGSATIPSYSEVTGFFGTIDVGTNCSPTFADIDADGDWDFLAGDLPGDLNCYLKQGFSWVENTALFSGISTDQNAAPALVDLDHDGDLDLVMGDYDGTFKYYRNLMYSGATLNPPLNLVAEISDQAQISWNEPEAGSTSPFVHYRVYLNGAFVASTSELYWSFTDLISGVAYTAMVTAEYIAGESLPVTVNILITGLEENLQIPVLLQNSPNPFNPSTTIRFSVKNAGTASLQIYNLKGQIVRSWEGYTPGEHSVIWNGCDNKGMKVSSGVYFYRLKTPGFVQVRKMIMQ
ncbi:MAG: FG-GAP-like repeat-containing protein, partial [Candidatus Cloacimonetes bacterium]|nr:FG-GAP-like repeat-containing protein [Candidatus Cloacimonadota bacterium]